MKRRRADELGELEAQAAKLAGDLERREAELETARQAVDAARQLEATALLDETNPSSARKSRVDAEAALAEQASDLDVRRRAAVALEGRLDVKRGEAHAEQLVEMTTAFRDALAKRNRVASDLNALLEQARALVERLESERARADALRAEMCTLADDPYHDPALSEEDEPARPDVEQLARELAAGARRPLEARADARRKAEVQQERSDREQVNLAVRSLLGLPARGELADMEIGRVPERLRAEVLERVERERAEARARADAGGRERVGHLHR